MASRAVARTVIPQPDPLPAQGEWTYEDYCRLPEDGWRYEVIRGVLHVTPAPNWKHQMASGNLFFFFRDFLRAKPLGKICAAPFDVLLPGKLATPVQPDLFFISRERLHLVKGNFVEGAPDLVVEILSPSNWLDDRKTKFEIYTAAGVREYWIADSREPSIEVFVLRNGAYEFLGKFGPGERVRSEVLPDFTPAIDEIFAD